jgi:hypothetical protein
MHSKLLGIAIVALLPLTGAVAAPTDSSCETAVRNSYNQNKNLKAAMESAVSSGSCASNGQAANAGYKVAGNNAALRSIVGSFASAAGVGVNQNFAGAGNVNVNFGSDSQGGGGGGVGTQPYVQ